MASSSSDPSPETPKLLMSFGVISDIQHSTAENGWNFVKTRQRFYQHALQATQRAVDAFNQAGSTCVPPTNPERRETEPEAESESKENDNDRSKSECLSPPPPAPPHPHPISCVIQAGDIIDGNARGTQLGSEATVAAVLDVLHKFIPRGGGGGGGEGEEEEEEKSINQLPRHILAHLSGNHENYNFVRARQAELFNWPSEDQAYWSFQPHKQVRIVILDSFDVSVLRHPKGSEERARVVALLREHNSNEDPNSPVGLEGLERRWVQFNGAIGEKQLSWLDAQLAEAEEQQQIVVVAAHVPVYEEASAPITIAWNHDQVMEILHRYTCVKLFISGHEHVGGYAMDPKGIHHRTLEAILTCKPGQNAFGFLDVYTDRIELHGRGVLQSGIYKFDGTPDTMYVDPEAAARAAEAAKDVEPDQELEKAAGAL